MLTQSVKRPRAESEERLADSTLRPFRYLRGYLLTHLMELTNRSLSQISNF